MQVKEEPRGSSGRRQRTRSETIGGIGGAICCEECEATFDSKQMRNDHALLAHASAPVTDDIMAEKVGNSLAPCCANVFLCYIYRATRYNGP